MQKNVLVTGHCPVYKQEKTISVPYIFNFDEWEKGIAVCDTPCSQECPIYNSAANTLTD